MPATSRMASPSRPEGIGARRCHTGSGLSTITVRPRQLPKCSTRGTATRVTSAEPSRVSASRSAWTRLLVSGLTPILAKPTVSPSPVSSCSTGLRFARAAPRCMLTLTSRPSWSRRYVSMVGAPAGTWTRSRSRSTTPPTPLRRPSDRARTASQARTDPGSPYRRTAAAAARRPAGTTSRGRRMAGSTMNSLAASRSFPDAETRAGSGHSRPHTSAR